MGSSQSSSLTPQEIEEVQKISHFSPREIRRLYKRFKRLDRDDDGTISTDEFMSVPELAMNPLVMRVISVFDEDEDDHVSFIQFVKTLSVFSVKANEEEKLRFAFKVYDVDEDGFVGPEELFEVLKMMVGSNLSDDQLRQIVDKTIAEADTDGDGKICFEEFAEVMKGTNMKVKMSIRF